MLSYFELGWKGCVEVKIDRPRCDRMELRLESAIEKYHN